MSLSGNLLIQFRRMLTNFVFLKFLYFQESHVRFNEFDALYSYWLFGIWFLFNQWALSMCFFRTELEYFWIKIVTYLSKIFMIKTRISLSVISNAWKSQPQYLYFLGPIYSINDTKHFTVSWFAVHRSRNQFSNYCNQIFNSIHFPSKSGHLAHKYIVAKWFYDAKCVFTL